MLGEQEVLHLVRGSDIKEGVRCGMAAAHFFLSGDRSRGEQGCVFRRWGLGEDRARVRVLRKGVAGI